MNKQLLEKLGIDSQLEPKKVLEELEEKQFEYLERLENVNDEERKNALTEELKEIDSEILSLKEYLKNFSSSMILDTVSEKVVEASQKKEEKKRQDDQVTQKVQEMKKKDEKIIENTAKENTNDSNTSTTVVKEQDDFTKALKAFKQNNYSEAFKIFKDLSEKGDADAQYLISVMYYDGLGIAKDEERARFWLKKAAEAGNTDAESLYGFFLLSENRDNKKIVKEGYSYLYNAAEKGSEDAMTRFVEAASLALGGKKEVKQAISYCDKLSYTADDSYNKESLKKTKKTLKKIKWGYTKKTIKPFLIFAVAIGLFLSIKDGMEKRPQQNIPSETPIVTQDARITAEAGNIRAGAGTGYDVIVTAQKGDVFVLTGNSEAGPNGKLWYEVYLDEETTGWVSETIIEIVEYK